jgi:hypothetical protein
LEHIEVIYIERKVETTEFNEFGVVIANLTLYLCQEVDNLSHVDEEVNDMIKTFYDPEVEKRGILIGEGIGKLSTKREDILELLEDVGNISDEAKSLVEKEENLEVLKRWHKLAARVSSIDEFLDRAILN